MIMVPVFHKIYIVSRLVNACCPSTLCVRPVWCRGPVLRRSPLKRQVAPHTSRPNVSMGFRWSTLFGFVSRTYSLLFPAHFRRPRILLDLVSVPYSYPFSYGAVTPYTLHTYTTQLSYKSLICLFPFPHSPSQPLILNVAISTTNTFATTGPAASGHIVFVSANDRCVRILVLIRCTSANCTIVRVFLLLFSLCVVPPRTVSFVCVLHYTVHTIVPQQIYLSLPSFFPALFILVLCSTSAPSRALYFSYCMALPSTICVCCARRPATGSHHSSASYVVR